MGLLFTTQTCPLTPPTEVSVRHMCNRAQLGDVKIPIYTSVCIQSQSADLSF